ncbi:CoA-transferase subunit beta [Geodermatophilus marinus]|uniref:CoA-transferase subunit beta n=1 Tax=Geodermatophilus sp. LHW52908 TaxID=2303986 RepID=UPI000E3E607A|nr:CoA-transferase [Geodermatophilus sp. LHW52908]RFU20502.1 CoA-transferase [Geodermatophilus sp. LHW52908]
MSVQTDVRTEVDPATVTRAEVCIAACADAWRGDGEILASPMMTVPTIAARTARATFEPDLLLSDGESRLYTGTWAIGETPPLDRVEGYVPFRRIFDILWSGKRHVMMSPSQVDRFGNANISALGEFARPSRQLLGVRGAPGNTVNHPTSYWIPKHSTRVFVEHVDMVAGVGYDRARAEGGDVERDVEIRRVVTNLAVLDFSGPERAMRLASVHPGVTVDQVVEATGFALDVPAEVPESRLPTAEELRIIREVVDPRGLRDKEVRA